jgi:hypothetical protein
MVLGSNPSGITNCNNGLAIPILFGKVIALIPAKLKKIKGLSQYYEMILISSS